MELGTEKDTRQSRVVRWAMHCNGNGVHSDNGNSSRRVHCICMPTAPRHIFECFMLPVEKPNSIHVMSSYRHEPVTLRLSRHSLHLLSRNCVTVARSIKHLVSPLGMVPTQTSELLYLASTRHLRMVLRRRPRNLRGFSLRLASTEPSPRYLPVRARRRGGIASGRWSCSGGLAATARPALILDLGLLP